MTVTPGDEQTSSTPRNLSPAEVHNVAFKKPPIGKRGYDEEEVDNFLDVVEAELSRLIEANEELKNRGGGLDDAALAQVTDQAVVEENRKLSASLQQLDGEHNSLKQRFEQLTQSHEGLQRSSQESGKGNAAAQDQIRAAEQRAQQAEQRAQQQNQQAQQQNQVLQQQVQQLQQQLQDAARNGGQSADTHQQAVKVLALAQQTADQHLAESQAESQRLVAEAQSQAQKLHQDSSTAAERRVNEAQTRADALHRDSQATAQKTISDAEQRAAAINDALETRKGALEGRVEELRTFEREYRSRLKSYLESQLRDLDHGGRDADQQNG